MPGSHPRDSRVIGLGCGLALGFLKAPQEISNVQDEVLRRVYPSSGEKEGLGLEKKRAQDQACGNSGHLF